MRIAENYYLHNALRIVEIIVLHWAGGGRVRKPDEFYDDNCKKKLVQVVITLDQLTQSATLDENSISAQLEESQLNSLQSGIKSGQFFFMPVEPVTGFFLLYLWLIATCCVLVFCR